MFKDQTCVQEMNMHQALHKGSRRSRVQMENNTIPFSSSMSFLFSSSQRSFLSLYSSLPLYLHH